MTDSDPRPPEGVWLEYADGTRYENLPTVYMGIDPDDDTHTWEIIAPREEPPTNAGLGLFPPKTSLVLPMMAPGSEIP